MSYGGYDQPRPGGKRPRRAPPRDGPDDESLLHGPFQRAFYREAPHLAQRHLEDVEELREALAVHVVDGGLDLPGPVTAFEELGLPPFIMRSLQAQNITAPTPIQAQGIPIVLEGHDFIGISQTGSGKTLSFLIPALVHIEARLRTQVTKQPLCLVLAPTRELAIQIAEESTKVSQGSRVTTACFYGGGPKWQQVEEAKRGMQVLVATPGRLIDFLDSDHDHFLSLSFVSFLVLDEADRMLDLGFGPPVQKIVGNVRPDRHTVFFSATWPEEVRALAAAMCTQRPVCIRVGQRDEKIVANHNIKQVVEVFDDPNMAQRTMVKEQRLCQYLREFLEDADPNQPSKVLIFVRTKQFADELARSLRDNGFRCDAMHGDRHQETRLQIVADFRANRTRILVATNVLSRGMDIQDVTHVIIYDFPSCIEDYIHRIGRTGRADKLGCAVVFFEYATRQSQLAGQLIDVLEEAGQEVPMGLRVIAREVIAGQRTILSVGDRGPRRGRGNDSGGGGGGGGSGWGNGGGGGSGGGGRRRGPRQTVDESEWAGRILPPCASFGPYGLCKVAFQPVLGSQWREAGDPNATFWWSSLEDPGAQPFRDQHRTAVKQALQQYMAEVGLPAAIRVALDVSHLPGIPRGGGTYWFSLGGGLCYV